MQSDLESGIPIGRRGREPTNKLPPERRRSRVLGVRLTADEYERVCAAAEAYQLTASAYLSAIALGTDLQVRVRLSSINELRRQGGLLKLALSQDSLSDESRERIHDVLHELKAAIRRVGSTGAQT